MVLDCDHIERGGSGAGLRPLLIGCSGAELKTLITGSGAGLKPDRAAAAPPKN